MFWSGWRPSTLALNSFHTSLPETTEKQRHRHLLKSKENKDYTWHKYKGVETANYEATLYFQTGKTWTFVVDKDFFPSLDSLTSYISQDLAVNESALQCQLTSDQSEAAIDKIFHIQKLPVKHAASIVALLKLKNDERMYLCYGEPRHGYLTDYSCYRQYPIALSEAMEKGRSGIEKSAFRLLIKTPSSPVKPVSSPTLLTRKKILVNTRKCTCNQNELVVMPVWHQW